MSLGRVIFNEKLDVEEQKQILATIGSWCDANEKTAKAKILRSLIEFAEKNFWITPLFSSAKINEVYLPFFKPFETIFQGIGLPLVPFLGLVKTEMQRLLPEKAKDEITKLFIETIILQAEDYRKILMKAESQYIRIALLTMAGIIAIFHGDYKIPLVLFSGVLVSGKLAQLRSRGSDDIQLAAELSGTNLSHMGDGFDGLVNGLVQGGRGLDQFAKRFFMPVVAKQFKDELKSALYPSGP